MLLFQRGGEHCAIRLGEVQEVVPMASLARPPGLPSMLEGFLNLRGSATPVLRLDRLFRSQPWSPGLYTPLVVLRSQLHPIALLVDCVDGILAAPDSALLPVEAEHCFNGCTEAEVVLEPDRPPIHLISSERLLLAQEQSRIGELRATAQQYLRELETGV